MSVAIEIRDLTKRFGKFVAIEKLNLTITPGEFLVLLGPSGCGKTTLLRCLAGLEEPDEGDILIDGETVFCASRRIAVPPAKRHVGMVFQSYALWPHMKVKDNIGFGLQIQKVPRAETQERVDQVLRDLDMGDLGERYPSELSGGQQQRVALARLLAIRPPVFLMDEPLSNLDARLRMDMRSELKRLHHDAGATTVYVTHDQTEAMTMASLVVVMNEGKILQAAAPGEIYLRPANLFVADFIGMPRINIVAARSLRRDGRSCLRIDDFDIPAPPCPADADLTLAARPEDIVLAVEPSPEAIEFLVHAVQVTGPEQLVQVRRGDTTLFVRENRELILQMDQAVWIKFDTGALNLYDTTSGQLLLHPDEEKTGKLTDAARN